MKDCDIDSPYNVFRKMGAVEELEEIKEEIVAKSCGKCEVDTWNNCKTTSVDGWCDVVDNIKIIDEHISKLKGRSR